MLQLRNDPTPAFPVSLDAPAPSLYQRWLKRLFDVTAVLLALPLVLPVLGVLAVLIARHGGKPLYGHTRVGRDGRRFRCWKLRSMVPNADAVLIVHLATHPAARAEWERSRKLENDPRITPLGRVLRKYSLDELPQLLNVLAGEMSLVGPRPITGQELRGYGAVAPAYLRLTPGITGLWQVSGRNRLDFAERIAFDAEYARRIGLRCDLGILLRTVRVVFGGSGR